MNIHSNTSIFEKKPSDYGLRGIFGTRGATPYEFRSSLVKFTFGMRERNMKTLNVLGGGLLATLMLTTTLSATDYSTWAKYRTVTLNTTGLTTAAVKKIPLALRFSVAGQFDMFTGATAALANGADIRVTKADGTTDVPFEIESWTAGASGSGVLWVLLDSVPANSATAYGLRVYWNKAGATSISAPTTVFDTANGYLAVWHMNQATNNQVDVTVKANAAVPTGTTPLNNSSVLGKGISFDGASYYTVGTGTTLSLNSETGPYTITAWVNPTSCGSRITIVSKYANDNSAGTRQFALQTGPTTTNYRMTNNPTSFSSLTANNEFVADVGACVDGTWSYLAGSYNTNGVTPTADATGAAFVSLSVDGAAATTGVTGNQATGTSIGTNAPFLIGNISSLDRFMNGTLDEITVSKVVRSADFVKLSFETQKLGATAAAIATVSVPPTALLPGMRAVPGFGIHAAGSKVTFKLPAAITGAKVSVITVSGREVWSRTVSADAREVSWNGAAASGMYLARTILNGATVAESKVMLP